MISHFSSISCHFKIYCLPLQFLMNFWNSSPNRKKMPPAGDIFRVVLTMRCKNAMPSAPLQPTPIKHILLERGMIDLSVDTTIKFIRQNWRFQILSLKLFTFLSVILSPTRISDRQNCGAIWKKMQSQTFCVNFKLIYRMGALGLCLKEINPFRQLWVFPSTSIPLRCLVCRTSTDVLWLQFSAIKASNPLEMEIFSKFGISLLLFSCLSTVMSVSLKIKRFSIWLRTKKKNELISPWTGTVCTILRI